MIHLQSTGQLELVMSSHKLRESRVQLCNAYGNNPNQLVQNMRLTLQAVSVWELHSGWGGGNPHPSGLGLGLIGLHLHPSVLFQRLRQFYYDKTLFSFKAVL